MESAFVLMISTLILVVAPDVKAEFPITRTNCGVSKYCVTVPADCSPESNSTCLFGSLKVLSQTPSNGINLHNELSGNSSGYIALGLTPSGGNTLLYICAKNSSNNSSFFFSVMSLNSTNPNNTLTLLNTTMPMAYGNVTGDKIQCVFNVSNLNATATTRSPQDSTFSIKIGTGSIDANGSIGAFSELKSTGPLNLANLFNTTVNATTAPVPVTTAPVPATTKSAATSVMQYHAGLILLSILGMFVFGTA